MATKYQEEILRHQAEEHLGQAMLHMDKLLDFVDHLDHNASDRVAVAEARDFARDMVSRYEMEGPWLGIG